MVITSVAIFFTLNHLNHGEIQQNTNKVTNTLGLGGVADLQSETRETDHLGCNQGPSLVQERLRPSCYQHGNVSMAGFGWIMVAGSWVVAG